MVIGLQLPTFSSTFFLLFLTDLSFDGVHLAFRIPDSFDEKQIISIYLLHLIFNARIPHLHLVWDESTSQEVSC